MSTRTGLLFSVCEAAIFSSPTIFRRGANFTLNNGVLGVSNSVNEPHLEVMLFKKVSLATISVFLLLVTGLRGLVCFLTVGESTSVFGLGVYISRMAVFFSFFWILALGVFSTIVSSGSLSRTG